MKEDSQYIILALIQGLTEFIPISSSAHLLLPSIFLDWPDQGLTFDIAVHVGSLLAVLVYFRSEIYSISLAWINSLSSKKRTTDSDLGWMIIAATIPAGIAGLVLNGLVETYLRSVEVIAIATLIFGILLGLADYQCKSSESIKEITITIAVVIGFAQVFAIIPGTSRSGITMTAALFCGLSRHSAARFSFLMSIPIIAGAGLFKIFEVLSQNIPVDWLQLFYSAAISAVSAFACIGFFLWFINRWGFMPFVLYRLFIGGLIIIYAV